MDCPECLSEMNEEAAVCGRCTRRIKGQKCSACGEFSRPESKVCIHCRSNLSKQRILEVFETMSLKASVPGSLFNRGRFIPQRIRLTPKMVVIETYGAFWLSRHDEEIPWENIAGYDFQRGIFWDSLVIETRGQTTNEITCLKKSQSKKIRRVFELMRN